MDFSPPKRNTWKKRSLPAKESNRKMSLLAGLKKQGGAVNRPVPKFAPEPAREALEEGSSDGNRRWRQSGMGAGAKVARLYREMKPPTDLVGDKRITLPQPLAGSNNAAPFNGGRTSGRVSRKTRKDAAAEDRARIRGDLEKLLARNRSSAEADSTDPGEGEPLAIPQKPPGGVILPSKTAGLAKAIDDVHQTLVSKRGLTGLAVSEARSVVRRLYSEHHGGSELTAANLVADSNFLPLFGTGERESDDGDGKKARTGADAASSPSTVGSLRAKKRSGRLSVDILGLGSFSPGPGQQDWQSRSRIPIFGPFSFKGLE